MATKKLLASAVLVLVTVSIYLLFGGRSGQLVPKPTPTQSPPVSESEQIDQRHNVLATGTQEESDLGKREDSLSAISVVHVDNDPVFIDADLQENLTQQQLQELAELPAVAVRLVSVNENELRERIRSAGVDGVLELYLIESEPLQITLSQSAEHHDGWQSGMASLVGRLVGPEASRVQLTVGIDGTVHGHFSYDNTYIRIGEYSQKGHHLIWSRDPSFRRKRHTGEIQ